VRTSVSCSMMAMPYAPLQQIRLNVSLSPDVVVQSGVNGPEAKLSSPPIPAALAASSDKELTRCGATLFGGEPGP